MRIGSKAVIFAVFLLFACGDNGERKNKIGHSGSLRTQPYCGNRDVQIDGVRLDVGFKKQECDDWCWAAVITMVADYYGRETSECSLATLRLDNLFECCVPSVCGSMPCNEPATHEDMSRILKDSGLWSRFYPRPLTEDELKLELSNGRPVIIGFNGVDASHVTVVTGFRPPEAGEGTIIYFALDPSLGVVSFDYENLRGGPVSGQYMPWIMSWRYISPREDGCNEQFDPLCGCETSP